MIQNMHKPFIEGNYKLTVDTRVIPIVENEDDKIQWECSTSISTDAGEPETLKEAMTTPYGHLWNMSAFYLTIYSILGTVDNPQIVRKKNYIFNLLKKVVKGISQTDDYNAYKSCV